MLGGAFRVLVDLIYSRIVLFQVFKSLLRCVKLWAKRRGVYGNVRAYKLGIGSHLRFVFICSPLASIRGKGILLIILVCVVTCVFWRSPFSYSCAIYLSKAPKCELEWFDFKFL